MINNSFYKYRPVTSQQQLGFVKDILLHNKLHLTEARFFTDPFDMVRYEASNEKIISLTTSPDNILLWSHYASWHQGVMIEFEFNENCILYKGLKKITYTDNFHFLTQELNKLNYYIKYSKFAFEKEWRYIANTTEPYLMFSNDTVKSLTFGASIKQIYKNEIWELCLEKNIKCYDYYKIDNLPQITEKKRVLTAHLQ